MIRAGPKVQEKKTAAVAPTGLHRRACASMVNARLMSGRLWRLSYSQCGANQTGEGSLADPANGPSAVLVRRLAPRLTAGALFHRAALVDLATAGNPETADGLP